MGRKREERSKKRREGRKRLRARLAEEGLPSGSQGQGHRGGATLVTMAAAAAANAAATAAVNAVLQLHGHRSSRDRESFHP